MNPCIFYTKILIFNPFLSAKGLIMDSMYIYLGMGLYLNEYSISIGQSGGAQVTVTDSTSMRNYDPECCGGLSWRVDTPTTTFV